MRQCGARFSWRAWFSGSPHSGRPSRRPPRPTRSARSSSSRPGTTSATSTARWAGRSSTRPYDVKVAASLATTRPRRVQLRRPGAPPVRCRHQRSFGDQTFSPGLAEPAGEAPLRRASARRSGSARTKATVQPGLHMSVSPDNGSGARMSYLRFEDQADGVHVFFDDVTNPGPVGTVSNFTDTDIATLSRDEGPFDPLLDHVQDGPRQRRRPDLHRRQRGDQGHVVGGLLPLRPRGSRQRQPGLAGQQAALPRGR